MSSNLRRKVSNDGKKFSAYIETNLPICLSNFVYFNMLIVKGMWWACIRTNFMIAVAQKTCFNQKITQKIHWNVARQSYNFFSSFFFNCFLRGCIDKRISLWHILLINMTWGIKLHGQKGSQCCSWGITTRKMAKTRVTIEFWFFWIFCILTIKFIEIYIWKHIGDRSVSQLIGIELFKDS